MASVSEERRCPPPDPTTRAIAAAAGVNEVTLFRHFGNKKNLLLACLGRFRETGFAATFQQHLTGEYAADIDAPGRGNEAADKGGRRRVTGIFQIGLIVAVILVVMAALLFIGLIWRPKSLPGLAAGRLSETRPVPEGLPAPVDRFFRTAYGDRVPVVETVIFTGSGRVRLGAIPFRGRWRYYLRAGSEYRHYMDLTLFGRPVMKINEFYREGRARLELPPGVVENNPKVDAAANINLWGESLWMPSALLDPRIRWEPVSEAQARMVIPLGDGTDEILVTFDPATGLVARMEAMRWKGEDPPEKTRWWADVLEWDRLGGLMVPTRFTITWGDEGRPWLDLRVEGMAPNADVSTYIASHAL